MVRLKKVPFSKVSGPIAAQQDSRLMALAPELRNKIYEEVLKDMEIAIPRRSKKNTYGRTIFPGILLACKQTHFEAIRLFWATTIFVLYNTTLYRLKSWLHNIGAERKALIAQVHYGDLEGDLCPPFENKLRRMEFAWAQRLVHMVIEEGGFRNGVVACGVRKHDEAPSYWSTAPMAEYRKVLEEYEQTLQESV